MLKTCSKCKSEKSISEFTKDPRYTDGLRSACKVCRAIVRRKRDAEPERRKRINELRRAAVARYVPREHGAKQCSRCKAVLDISEFFRDKNSSDGHKSWCKSCASTHSYRTYRETERGHRERERMRNRVLPWAQRCWFSARNASKLRIGRGRDCPLDLTVEQIESLWEVQSGLCYFAKVPMSTERNRLDTVSIDRLDPNRGYVLDNIVLSTKAMNFAKTGHSVAEFKGFLSSVIDALK